MEHVRHSFEANPTVFGKILRGEIPCNKVYEDEFVLAFHDIAPQAPVHVVVIPKAHVVGLQGVEDGDAAMLGRLMVAIPKVAAAVGVLETGFRVITNAGAHGGQEVPHLHLHLLGGRALGPKIV